MRWRDADLVHEQLRSLVGMDIMEPRCKADNSSPVLRDSDMMTRILKEFVDEIRFYGMVENTGRYMLECDVILLG